VKFWCRNFEAYSVQSEDDSLRGYGAVYSHKIERRFRGASIIRFMAIFQEGVIFSTILCSLLLFLEMKGRRGEKVKFVCS
jgi:hypothetical protein